MTRSLRPSRRCAPSARETGSRFYATEDAAAFTKARLARYGVVVFLLTIGDVLDETEQAAFMADIRSGGGFVGRSLGRRHRARLAVVRAPACGRLVVGTSRDSGRHDRRCLAARRLHCASSSALGPHGRGYGFLSNRRRNGVRVLLTLDEATYQPRDWAMGADHPIAWKHEFDGGRAWYTQGGHTKESYAEPLFVRHLLGGIRHALGGASLLAPTFRSLNLTVRGRRVLVAASRTLRTVYRRMLRVRSTSARLRMAGGSAKGSSASLPRGRWQVTVVLTDRDSGLSRTARRWVRIT